MNDEAMLRALEAHHRAIEAGMGEIRLFCKDPGPNSGSIGYGEGPLSDTRIGTVERAFHWRGRGLSFGSRDPRTPYG
jgi:hypothetical protein